MTRSPSFSSVSLLVSAGIVTTPFSSEISMSSFFMPGISAFTTNSLSRSTTSRRGAMPWLASSSAQRIGCRKFSNRLLKSSFQRLATVLRGVRIRWFMVTPPFKSTVWGTKFGDFFMGVCRVISSTRTAGKNRQRDNELGLENIARQILVTGQMRQVLIHIRRIHRQRLAAFVGRLAGNGFEQALYDGVQAACADVLGFFVHLEGDLGDTPHTVRRERQRHALGAEQGRVLFGERGIRFGKNAHEVF